MTLMLNIFLCLDLILVITNPFNGMEKRLKFYLIFSAIPSLLWSFISINAFGWGDVYFYIGRYAAIGSIGFFWMIAIISIFYGLIKLCRPGISYEIRSIVLKRHILTICVYILCNIYFMLGVIFIYKPDYA